MTWEKPPKNKSQYKRENKNYKLPPIQKQIKTDKKWIYKSNNRVHKLKIDNFQKILAGYKNSRMTQKAMGKTKKVKRRMRKAKNKAIKVKTN